MNMAKQSDMSSKIWKVADILWGPFKKAEYGRVILPFTVLRRLECVMAPKRQAVYETYTQINGEYTGVVLDRKLKSVAGALFYNTTEFSLSNLGTVRTAKNLFEYINGFNSDIVEIFEKFEFNLWIGKLIETETLHAVINEFKDYDLSIQHIDNHDMGSIFEELIRKFSESANDTAGEFFTPRDVVELTTELTFAHADSVFTTDDPIRIYDPTAGAGGFLTVGNDMLKRKGRDADVSLFGQELNGESYAICRADMTILGHDPRNIKKGDTLKTDLWEGEQFDFCLANPPYGSDWKTIKDDIAKEHSNRGYAGRFGAGIPRVSDGSMLFLQHIITKMDKRRGTAGIVLSGSPLFTGGAGGGESEIRRWVLENDFLDAIIALPNNLFYNTGIATYIWILSKNKLEERKNKVILINAVEQWQTMRKSLGDKRRYINDTQRKQIVDLYYNYQDTKCSKIFNTTDFGYRKVTIERPLQLKYTPHDTNAQENIVLEKSFITWCNKQDITPAYVMGVLNNIQSEYMSESVFLNDLQQALVSYSMTTTLQKLLRKHFGTHDSQAEYITDNQGNIIADTNLRDYENVPLGTDIYTYFDKEVKPHVPDAWIDETDLDHKDGKVGKVGYEISFNRYFYEYQSPRPLAEIETEIQTLESEIMKLLGGITN